MNSLKLLICIFSLLLFNIFLMSDEEKPDIKTVDPKVIEVSNLNRTASYLIGQDEFEQALIVLKKAIAIDPKNYSALVNLTIVYINTEKFEEARQSAKNANSNFEFYQLTFLIETCLNISPASKEIRKHALIWAKELQALNAKMEKWTISLVANTYFRNNELDKALEIINPYITKDPINSRFNILLGNIYTKKGDYKLATTYLLKAMNREPAQAFTQNHIAYQLITYDDEADNRPVEALPLAIAASNATNQKTPDIEDTLGLAYFMNKDFVHAVEAQERAVKYLREELPELQKDRSPKLAGFRKQLKKYNLALKKSKE